LGFMYKEIPRFCMLLSWHDDKGKQLVQPHVRDKSLEGIPQKKPKSYFA
jgi:hypothetical protein